MVYHYGDEEEHYILDLADLSLISSLGGQVEEAWGKASWESEEDATAKASWVEADLLAVLEGGPVGS